MVRPVDHFAKRRKLSAFAPSQDGNSPEGTVATVRLAAAKNLASFTRRRGSMYPMEQRELQKSPHIFARWDATATLIDPLSRPCSGLAGRGLDKPGMRSAERNITRRAAPIQGLRLPGQAAPVSIHSERTAY